MLYSRVLLPAPVMVTDPSATVQLLIAPTVWPLNMGPPGVVIVIAVPLTLQLVPDILTFGV